MFFDGGCRPNPGPMEAAVVIRGVPYRFEAVGVGSNEDAEWLALIHALRVAQEQQLARFELVGDALDVIRQANAALSTGHPTGPHSERLLTLVAQGAPARIRWIKREQNLAGILLEAGRNR